MPNVDRARLTAIVENIRSMLQEELASHRGSTLEGNCAAGVRICDELLEKVADDGDRKSVV